MSNNFNKLVAIIGAGPSGLVAAKEALLNGLVPIIFEKSTNIGGLWSVDHSSCGVWSNMQTNISKYTTCYTDFAWPKNTPLFPTAPEVFNYLTEYAKHFKLQQHLKLKCEVKQIEKIVDQNNKWKLTWLCLNTNKIKTEFFNYCVITSGIFTKPYIPTDINNLINSSPFKYSHLHSKFYRSNDSNYKNKSILVIGSSFSACEIASNLIDHNKSNKVINLINRPYWVIPRFIPKSFTSSFNLYPNDYVFNSFNKYLKTNLNRPASKTIKLEDEYKLKNNYFAKLCPNQSQVESSNPLYIDSNSTEPPRVIISDKYVDYVKDGKIIVNKSKIKKFTKSGDVCLEDGSSFHIDFIILATGYKLEFDFFNKSILDILSFDSNDRLQPILLYKSTFHPDLANLAFVSIYKGPYFALMELQAKWAMKLFTNKLSPLPSREEMFDDIKLEKFVRDLIPRPQFPYSDYIYFAKSIANKLNLLPDLDLIKSNESNLYKLLIKLNMMTPAIFNLNNKDKKQEAIQQLVDCYQDINGIKDEQNDLESLTRKYLND